MFIRDFIICVPVGAVLLLLLGPPVGKVRFSLSTAFWCSFIGQMMLWLIGFISAWTIGTFFPNLSSWVSLAISTVIGWHLQAALLFIAIRSKGGTLSTWRANVLSAILIAFNSFITVPLVETSGIMFGIGIVVFLPAAWLVWMIYGGSTAKDLAASAERGNADAQCILGESYYFGIGVPQDFAKALEFFQMAAEQGNAVAQINLGCLYERGHGVPKDLAKASEWFQKAAAKGKSTEWRTCLRP